MRRVPFLLVVGIAAALALSPQYLVGQEKEWREVARLAINRSAMLVYENPRTRLAFCGSTIVRASQVLTAWHCVSSVDRMEALWVYLDDGTKFKVTGIIMKKPGWDLVLLSVPGVGRGEVFVNEDIARGDEVMAVGAMDGEAFKSSWGRIDRIYEGHYDPCPPSRRLPDVTGGEPHQIVEVDRVAFFGTSGGGVWNKNGDLVGVNVRGHFWQPYPGYACSDSYKGEYLMYAIDVGPKTILEFLRGR